MSSTSGEESEINQQTRMTGECSACGERIPVAELTCPKCGWRHKTPPLEYYRKRPRFDRRAEQFREPGLVTIFQVIGMLSLIGGAILALGLSDRETYALGLLGISAIVNAVIMFGFAAVIKNVAEIAWHSRKATEQREAVASQGRENAKALQWLVDNCPWRK